MTSGGSQARHRFQKKAKAEEVRLSRSEVLVELEMTFRTQLNEGLLREPAE